MVRSCRRINMIPKIAQNNLQQGDVIMRRLDSMPEGKRKVVAKGRIIVKHGESGHAHVIDAPESEAQLIDIGGRMILELEKAQALQHVLTPHGNEPLVAGEHDASQLGQTYDAGIWEVDSIQEVDHFTQTVRPVMD